MAYAGQSITHPTLGITMDFIKTHKETNGIGWEVNYSIDPNSGKELKPHIHLHSDEWFQILKGSGRYVLNGKERRCEVGDEIYIPAGKPHIHPWNTGNQPLVMRNLFLINHPEKADKNEILKMEEYYEHWFHLACRGRVKEDGSPYFLQSAVFLNAMRKQLEFKAIPKFIQNMILSPLAIAGKLMGYTHSAYE